MARARLLFLEHTMRKTMPAIQTLIRSTIGDDLQARVLQGGIWLGGGITFEQVLRLARNMVLTRILLPEAFGTMAIVMSVAAAFESLTQIGIRDAIVQNPRGSEDEYLNAAWWLSVGRAAILCLTGYLVAPICANFYNNPSLTPLLRVALLAVLFRGAISPRAYAFLKEMRFGRWTWINHGGAIAGILGTIALAVVWPNIWALVIGFSAESLGRCILSFILGPWRPTLRIQRSSLGGLLHFSRGVFGLPMLAFLCGNVDIFVIGKMFSPSDLGVYGLVVYLGEAPAAFVLNLIAQLAVPAFSRMQDDNERTNRLVLGMTSALAIGCLPVFVFACLYAQPLLTLVYGKVYARAAAPFALACGIAVAQILNGPLTAVLFARGIPRVHWRFLLSRTVVLLALIVPLVKSLGMAGAPLAALLAVLVGCVFQMERIVSLTGFDLRRYGTLCLPAFLILFTVIVVRYAAAWVFPQAAPVALVATGLTACALTYPISFAILANGKFP